MSRRIQSAIANVDKLLAAKQAPTSRRPVKAPLKAATKVSSSARKLKILAMLGMGSKPNLRLLNKLITREVITAQEVVDAVGEALFLKRVNKRVIEAITMALKEALGTSDVIDMEEAAA